MSNIPNIPKDPYLLYSFVNVKLRDEFDTFEDMCASLDVQAEDILQTLGSAGFSYDETVNQFR